jgi:cysteinyl-tRNA synthetase
MTELNLKLYDDYLKRSFILNPKLSSTRSVIRMYSCGPTVYAYQSIGNMRAVWLPDTIHSLIKLVGIDVDWALNITDVGHLVGDGDAGEDKIEKAARNSGKTAEYIIDHYTLDYKAQCEALNFALPQGKYNPKATEFIPEQMVLAITLMNKKLAYHLDDGIYFDFSAFIESNLAQSEQIKAIIETELKNTNISTDYTGREIKNTQKDPRDFALWKFVEQNAIQKWRFLDYPTISSMVSEENYTPTEVDDLLNRWGCPGWHSECVCMICGVLRNTKNEVDLSYYEVFKNLDFIIDLHTGGEDHIEVHHKNEILQSEALGFKLSEFWIHNGFVMIDGGKMSKSKGNVYLVTGSKSETGFESLVEKGFDPLAYRLMLFEHHYREQMNFTWEKLEQSQTRLYNIRKLSAMVRYFARKNAIVTHNTIEVTGELLSTLLNNLDTPKFMELYSALLLTCVNEIREHNSLSVNQYTQLVVWEVEFLKLDLFPVFSHEVIALLLKREKEKEAKNYEIADLLRKQIQELGLELDDYSFGSAIWQKSLTKPME